VPVRCVKFIARKNWFVAGSDDFQLRVFNYNTHEKVASFEAHPDYIRCLTVHPTASIVLTGSDDMTIKAWDWDKNWKNIQVRSIVCSMNIVMIPRMYSDLRRPHTLHHEYRS
jgi:coatomer subunit beta'